MVIESSVDKMSNDMNVKINGWSIRMSDSVIARDTCEVAGLGGNPYRDVHTGTVLMSIISMNIRS